MSSLQALGPLLLGTRKGPETGEQDRDSKRHKPTAAEEQLPAQTQRTQAAMVQMLKVVAQLVINHERSLNNLFRQDCYVMYVQSDPQGALPILNELARKWKEQAPQQRDHPQWQTMRTYLLAGLMKELYTRACQLQASKAGEALWDTAQQKGTLTADGSWVFQRWSSDQGQLVQAPKAPMPMQRMMKTLETVNELLQHNSHVIRFHSLRAQKDVVPWCLQLTLRDPELWHLMQSITHCTIWSLLGMTVKQHNQQMSKQATALTELLGKSPPGTQKGQGKGKHKGKTQKS